MPSHILNVVSNIFIYSGHMAALCFDSYGTTHETLWLPLLEETRALLWFCHWFCFLLGHFGAFQSICVHVVYKSYLYSIVKTKKFMFSISIGPMWAWKKNFWTVIYYVEFISESVYTTLYHCLYHVYFVHKLRIYVEDMKQYSFQRCLCKMSLF